MSWNFTSSKPIFGQIVDILKKDIVSGKYTVGDKMPTVRDLAIEAGVNPNTVQRAYGEIEALGLIYTKRGDGRYVSDNQDLIARQGKEELETTVFQFVSSLKNMGFSHEEILTSVKTELEKQ